MANPDWYLRGHTQGESTKTTQAVQEQVKSGASGYEGDLSTYTALGRENTTSTAAATQPAATSTAKSTRTSSSQTLADLYQTMMNQRQQAAQTAHTQGTQRLEDTYNNLYQTLQSNLDSTISDLDRQYAASQTQVNQNADTAQQQAYINYMLSKRDLPQALMAQGLTGGASESTLADLMNSYGNSRNQIDTQRNASLAELSNTLLDGKSAAQRQYNQQKASADQQKATYQQQLDEALASLQTGILDSAFSQLQSGGTAYAQTLQNLLQAQSTALQNAANATYAATNANAAANVSTQQGAATARAGNDVDANVVSQIVKMLNEDDASVEDVVVYLGAQGLTQAQIRKNLNSIGVDVG